MIGIRQNVSACAAFLGYLQRSEPNSQDPGVQLWPLVYTAADPASPLLTHSAYQTPCAAQDTLFLFNALRIF